MRSTALEYKWLGSVIWGRVLAPTIVVANVDGGARILALGCSFSSSPADGFLVVGSTGIISGLFALKGSGDSFF
jgi:hypothetical protein